MGSPRSSVPGESYELAPKSIVRGGLGASPLARRVRRSYSVNISTFNMSPQRATFDRGNLGFALAVEKNSASERTQIAIIP